MVVEGWAEASVEQSLLKMVGRGFGGFNSTVPGTGRRGIFFRIKGSQWLVVQEQNESE